MQQGGSTEAAGQLVGRLSAAIKAAETDSAAIAVARQRLQAYLQQQDGISQARAADLASRLSAKLGAAADELMPPPLQFFVGRGMQPRDAAELAARICEAGGHASYIRYWPKWQPVFQANWQLADSHLAAYRQQCKQAQQRPLKGSESMAAMLSTMPSRYTLLLMPDVASKLAALQQGQAGLRAAEVGQLIVGWCSQAAKTQMQQQFAGWSAFPAAALQLWPCCRLPRRC